MPKSSTKVPTHVCKHCKKELMPNDWVAICPGCNKVGCRLCMITCGAIPPHYMYHKKYFGKVWIYPDFRP